MMRHLTVVFLFIATVSAAQRREASPLVYEKSYSHTAIHKSLRDLVDKNTKAAYFEDRFFNAMLKKVLEDPQFSAKEKVQLFYLMMQKIGYAFAGVEYLPPSLNYFRHHMGKVYVLGNTSKHLHDVKFPVAEALRVARETLAGDPLLASNALLLATLVQPDSVQGDLEKYLDAESINASKQPAIFNHNLCLAASLTQNERIVDNLRKLLTGFKKEEMIEDVFCAMYAMNNPVTPIQDYILAENDPANDLAIQTALNALAFRVPDASYRESIRSIVKQVDLPWKKELLKKLLSDEIPFSYALASAETLVVKVWQGFTASQYLNGTLVSIGDFMEFDPS